MYVASRVYIVLTHVAGLSHEPASGDWGHAKDRDQPCRRVEL